MLNGIVISMVRENSDIAFESASLQSIVPVSNSHAAGNGCFLT